MNENNELVTVNWNPLFSSMLDSSVWAGGTKEEKLVWITLLAKKNRHGFVDMSLPGVAKAAGVTIQEAEAAVKKFESPDAYSRNAAHEGRRIEPCTNGGWVILNHLYYRKKMQSAERREYLRRKQAEFRERKKAEKVGLTDAPHQ